jgi:glycine cleavage system aminomethyltransferase T
VGVERIVEITGPDAFTFTNMLTCRDLSRCAVGQCKYAPIIDEQGGIINDPVLLRLHENQFWLALADSDVLLWAKGVALHSGLNVQLTEPDVSPIQVQGPDSKPVMQALFGDVIKDLRYYFCLEATLDGIPVVVSRTGWTAEVGYEIYLRDGSRGDDLWERVMAAGKPYQIMPIAPCEARRIEAGIFNYGSDMRLENNPYEVTGMERLVELDSGADFIGRKALERVRAQGVQRKLVGVDISGDSLAAELTAFWPVMHTGRRVGHVTDAIYSPRLRRNIGYAWVPIELAAIGTELEARAPGGELQARVAALPFLDPKKTIPIR